jgi:hypothetical protein
MERRGCGLPRTACWHGSGFAESDHWLDPRPLHRACEASLGDPTFAIVCAEGRAMPAVEAIALAREQALLLP